MVAPRKGSAQRPNGVSRGTRERECVDRVTSRHVDVLGQSWQVHSEEVLLS